MSASFTYGLKARYYGLLFQLPWSFFITLGILLPILLTSDVKTVSLLVHLLIYWTGFSFLFWLYKDIAAQKKLYDIHINQQKIWFSGRGHRTFYYLFQHINTVKSVQGSSRVSGLWPDGGGLVIRFKDGFELTISNKITHYDALCRLLGQSPFVA